MESWENIQQLAALYRAAPSSSAWHAWAAYDVMAAKASLKRRYGEGRMVWRTIGLGAAFAMVIAASQALHAVAASPAPSPLLSPVKIARAKSFAATCTASDATDTRPDPAWIGQSFAHDNCQAPQAPPPVDGLTARRDQIEAAMTAAKNYTASAHVYQKCITDFVTARRAKPANRPADLALVTIETHRILASESNAKKIDSRMKAAINAFNAYGSDCPG